MCTTTSFSNIKVCDLWVGSLGPFALFRKLCIMRCGWGRVTAVTTRTAFCQAIGEAMLFVCGPVQCLVMVHTPSLQF